MIGSIFYEQMVSLHGALAQLFAVKTDKMIDLDTISPTVPTAFIRKDGSLISVIEINGLLSGVSGRAYYRHLDNIVEIFSDLLKEGSGHSLQIVFKRDPFGFTKLIDEVFRPSLGTLDALGIDWSWLLESRKKALSKWCAEEKLWLTFETNYEWMSKEVRKSVLKEKQEKALNVPYTGKEGWSVMDHSVLMLDRHRAAVESFVHKLNVQGISANLLNAKDAAHIIREEMIPEMTSEAWEVRTHESKVKSVRVPDYPIKDKGRLRGLAVPFRLDRQIFPVGPTFVEGYDNYVRIGQRIYAPLAIEVPPLTPKRFEMLVDTINKLTKMPFRISFRFQGGIQGRLGMKSIVSSFMSILSSETRSIYHSIREIKRMAEQGYVFAGMRISAVTWVSDQEGLNEGEKLKVLGQRVQMLAQAFQSWGQADVSDVVGLPVLGVTTTVPALAKMDTSPEFAAPLDEVATMLPLSRVGSPWKHGAMLFRTDEGRLMPYQPGSSLQSSWTSIGFAPPGGGKSVLLSSLMIASIMAPGQQTLPFIGIIDIGPSSRGLVDLIRASLPENQQEQALYVMPYNEERYAINPFDLHLGCDFPDSIQRTFITNFLSILVSEKPQEGITRSVNDLLIAAVDGVYQQFSRKGRSPKIYDPTADKEIAEFVRKVEIVYDEATTWWEIVDALFEKGYKEWAAKAQRYAVFTLSDFSVYLSSSQEIETRFERTLINNIASAIMGVIQRFPILSVPTRFSLTNVRVVSMNLEAICPAGEGEARRQTAAMYMLVRQAMVNRFQISENIIEQLPSSYHNYYYKLIETTKAEAKIFCYDEFHRTGGITGVQNMIERDIREGRKFGYQIMLFSQQYEHFTADMIELSTTQFILSDGPKDIDSEFMKKMQEKFGFSDSDMLQISKMHGPTSKGAMAFMISRLKMGISKMMLFNTIGAVEMWALETNNKNRALREKVILRMGLKTGLFALAYAFPSGSAVSDMEKYARTRLDADDDQDIIEHFANMVERRWNEAQMAKGNI